jgi:hypothetical protein
MGIKNISIVEHFASELCQLDDGKTAAAGK